MGQGGSSGMNGGVESKNGGFRLSSSRTKLNVRNQYCLVK